MKGTKLKGIGHILAALALAASAPCLGQPNLLPGAEADGPRAVLERFLALNAASALDRPEGRALLGGQLDGARTPTFGPLVQPDRIVMLAGGRAVARLPGEGEARQDLYLYLNRRGDVWTIDAVRALALTGIPRELRRLLRGQASRTPQEEELLANVELTLACDQDLRAWFANNRNDLETLRGMAQDQRGTGGDDDRAILTPDSTALLHRLHLLALSASRDGLVRVTIGGMTDNEVGFLHASDPALVPPIDPIDHIWIEPLGDGWYLFRTT